MTKKNKILLLLPDGISLKNFAFSKFYDKAHSNNLDVCFWNATPFDLKALGYNEVKLPKPKLHKLTEVYKNVRKHIELNIFKSKFSNSAFNTYKFPFKYNTIKNSFKSILCQLLIFFNNSEKGLLRIRTRIIKFERSTNYYSLCHSHLKEINPSIVFCTNQRPVTAIAPILAARDLKIPTTTFIFSWDNLPKATIVIETDYYFVWSDYMKQEILKYYPYINKNQVFVTGTPQFEEFISTYEISKNDFYKKYDLDVSKKYICYSGDDVTTSPDDPEYLNDVALALMKLNEEGCNLGLIFRRSPVDFSGRYDSIIKKFKDLITPINPIWQEINDRWDGILPTKEDQLLLKETVLYTEMVVNLGSTMVFDYAIENKPCAYINYDVKKRKIKNWSVTKIYNYLHFKSMPNKDSVIWLNSSEKIAQKLKLGLNEPHNYSNQAQDWFKVINRHPKDEASNNIITAIKDIISLWS